MRCDAMRWIGKCSKAECRKDSQKILCIDSWLSKPFNEHGMYLSQTLLIAVAIVAIVAVDVAIVVDVDVDVVDVDDDDDDVW